MTDLITYGLNTSYDHINLAELTANQDAYTDHFRHFARYAGERGGAIDYELIRSYFTYLNESDYSASTVRVRRQAVKKRILQASVDWPIDERIKLKEILSDLDRFGDTRAPKMATNAIGSDKVITESERLMLISQASTRLGLIMEFLYLTGCRVSELTGIKIGHCERKGETVYFRITGKGNKQRTVRVKAPFYNRIREYFSGEQFLFETQGGKAYSRVYISDQIRKLSLRVLGRGLSAHCFRHSFATRKVKNTGNLKGVSEYLGHSSVSITADMYVHSLLSDGELLEDSIIN